MKVRLPSWLSFGRTPGDIRLTRAEAKVYALCERHQVAPSGSHKTSRHKIKLPKDQQVRLRAAVRSAFTHIPNFAKLTPDQQHAEVEKVYHCLGVWSGSGGEHANHVPDLHPKDETLLRRLIPDLHHFRHSLGHKDASHKIAHRALRVAREHAPDFDTLPPAMQMAHLADATAFLGGHMKRQPTHGHAHAPREVPKGYAERLRDVFTFGAAAKKPAHAPAKKPAHHAA